MGSVGASARVVFPFAVAKVLLFAELAKYFTGKIQTNFHRFSHTAGAQPLTPKTFSHTKTATKKQCASRPATHTLYNIENEFLIKISDSIKLHFFSAKKIRKATFVAYFNFDSFLIHFKFCHIRRFTQLNISIKIKQIFNRQGKDTDKIRETHSFWRNFSILEQVDALLSQTIITCLRMREKHKKSKKVFYFPLSFIFSRHITKMIEKWKKYQTTSDGFATNYDWQKKFSQMH